ncbi:glycosyltransferase family 2 protein, partial [Candidatus Woesebacteria bacterium]
MKIFIVIPAYQEEERIGNVIRDVTKTKFPIVVVDDGSKDNTFKIASKYRVTALRHKVNLGKGAAMKTGAEVAFKMGADAIVFMDSDGQHKAK